jgi:chromate transporter
LIILKLFYAFARVGALHFGGGPSAIPLIKIEAVNNYSWMTSEEFADAFAISNSLPGPIATKMAGWVGFKAAGVPGALASVIGIVTPSLVFILLLFRVMDKFKGSPQLAGMIKAVRPVVVVLLVQLVLETFPKSVVSPITAAIAVVSLIAIQAFNVHPALIVVGALAFGAVALR